LAKVILFYAAHPYFIAHDFQKTLFKCSELTRYKMTYVQKIN